MKQTYYDADDPRPDFEIAGSEYQRLEREVIRLQAIVNEITAFTEWAKDTDLSGDDWLTELRHPEQITAKMVWDMAMKSEKGSE